MLVTSAPHVPTDLRSAPGNTAEERLVGRAATCRAAATTRLRESLGGYDPDELSEATDDGVFQLLAVAPDLVDRLVEDATWDEVLRDQVPGHPFLAHISGPAGEATGRPLHDRLVAPSTSPVEQARVNVAATAAALRAGDTIVVNRVDQFDHGALRGLCESLESLVGTRVGVNAYVSREGAQGFGAHWDDHGVVVVQVLGRKLWEVFAPAHLSARTDYVHRAATGPSVWSGVLEPGAALVIPRGWPHRVIGLDELSVHYTIGFTRPVYLDVLDLALTTGRRPDDGTDVRTVITRRLAASHEVADQVLASHRGEIPTRPGLLLADADRWLHGHGVVARLEVLLHAAPAFIGAPDDDAVHLRWNRSDVMLSHPEAAWLASWPPPDGDEARRFGAALLTHGLARVASA